jgi:alpha-tubulin suppressor-like RCC1 family protein
VIRYPLVCAVAAAAIVACGDEPSGLGDNTPVAAVTIRDIPGPLLIHQRVKLEAQLFDRQGNALADRQVAWESADPAVASVTAGGALTAGAPGTALIRATVEGIVDSVLLTVRALQLAHVYVGTSLSCGLEETGEAWCWGNVGAAGYGNGSADTARRDVPSRAAVGHLFASLALARASACGIELSGGVVCWGENRSGQLGDGTTTAHDAPAPVGGLTGIVQLTAGESHFCARSGAGGVSCWGSNDGLQTGESVRGIVTQPRPVLLNGPATDISAGPGHSCAVVAGHGYCWGADFVHQLGHDTTYNRLVPTLAATGDGVSRTWVEVEASNGHTCGRDVGGAVFCWGLLSGEGDNDTLSWLPMRRFETVVATDLAGGWFVQCAVSGQQTAVCGGRTFPQLTLAATGPVALAAVAGSQACVLQAGGAVACELGTGSRGSLTDVPLPAPATQLVASDQEACALDNLGAVYCWATWDALVPQQVFAGATQTGVYGNSGSRVCAIAQGGAVSCRSSFGGAETIEPTGGVALVSLAVGDDHTCGVTAAGAAWCWGANAYGQLGDGTMTDRAAAVAVQGGHAFTRITAGIAHTCGLTAAGAIYCWGYGSQGSMADDHRDESAAPVSVDGTPDLTLLGTGTSGGCGLDGAGAAWCWPISYEVPTGHQVGGATGLITLTATCGLRSTGEMLCWGSNSGWFGDGTFGTTAETAVAGGNGLRFAAVSFGPAGTACGIALDGATYCWGNASGTSLGSPEASGELATLPLKVYGSP